MFLRSGSEDIGDPQSRRGQAGEQCRALRGADRCGRVGIGKANALFCKRIELRRFVKLVAVATQFLPTQIVSEDQNDVGRPLRFLGIHERSSQQPEGDHRSDAHQKRPSQHVALLQQPMGSHPNRFSPHHNRTEWPAQRVPLHSRLRSWLRI